jgi:hypothetical protein
MAKHDHILTGSQNGNSEYVHMQIQSSNLDME